ncbi:SlyX family protein [Alkalimarinus alittae]|uniref:Protein SlyX homolog n=1 Tax=Alkalimarinus alittae TaxID=2961619 RepID=A0ABY6MZ64_9ALTE|nr:SlyX family protein [Alkalimarinus alittae]UZE95100.1 SlyX family protein [Alkalimarinus alittae]
MNTEDRLTELETKMAFQEDLLQDLNDVVARQEQQLDKLWQANKMLKSQLDSVNSAPGEASHEAPPPHY